jgi:hypothetical protein
MSFAKRLLMVLAMAPLGACGATWHPKMAGDTACLSDQVRNFHVPFYQAVDICHTPLPDLTGDAQLQTYASAWGIPYQYNPRLDAQIKRMNWYSQVPIGSHIPTGQYGLTSAEISP